MECWNPAGCRIYAIPLQREFYNANLRYTKERTVVIISDAMRYEVGQELFARMQDDPKCTAKLSVQLSLDIDKAIRVVVAIVRDGTTLFSYMC